MWYIVLGIVILGLLSACFHFFRKNKQDEFEPKEIPQDCCGEHQLCERDSLLAAVSTQVEYYDDEELDTYCGQDAGAYSEKAIEEFREILYTLKDVEVAGWVRSLQLRGIDLPDNLKDEVYLIIGERRI